MSKPAGRPPGLIILPASFEAIASARGMLKKDVAEAAGVSPSFLADLLARRGGASQPKAQKIADALRVEIAAIFPEADGWVSPLPERDRSEKAVAA